MSTNLTLELQNNQEKRRILVIFVQLQLFQNACFKICQLAQLISSSAVLLEPNSSKQVDNYANNFKLGPVLSNTQFLNKLARKGIHERR